MEEKKKIKISLGTAICIVIIVILIMALVGMYIYNKSNGNIVADNKTSEDKSQTTNNENQITDVNYIEEKMQLSENWIPYKAEENGEEISLNYIWGTSIKNGGFLTFNKDGTYSEFIGAYSDEAINSLQGQYAVEGDTITFISNNRDISIAKYIIYKDGTKVIKKQELKDNRYVYFKDNIDIEGVEYQELNSEIDSNEIFALNKVDSDKNGNYILYGAIYKRNEFSGTLCLGNYKKITVSPETTYIDYYETETNIKTTFENKTYNQTQIPITLYAHSILLNFQFDNGKCVKITEWDLPT